MFLACLVASVIALAVSNPAQGQCGGLCAYEVGGPDNAMSAAGASARASDAATALFNVAGATRLDGTHIMVNTVLGFVDQEFELGSGTFPRGTNGGGSVGTLIPLGSAFIVTELYKDLRFTFAFAGLYGGQLDYNNDWAGRTWVTESSLAGLGLSPGFAYPLTDWLSVGGSVNVTWFKLDYQLKAGNDRDAPTIEFDDGQDWAVNGTFSVLLEPWEHTRIGFNYRSPLEANLEGDLEIPVDITPEFDTKLNFAQGFNIGIFHQFNEDLALLFDAGWSDWSTMKFQAFDVGRIGVEIPRKFHDTWRIALGGQYKILEEYVLRGGFSYDSSAVKAKHRLPDMPVSEQYRFSAGLNREVTDNITLGLSYTLLWMANNEIDNVKLPGGVTLDGEYDPSFIHFVGFNVGINFGGEKA
jgi:long-chain fatty acid transport protein